MDFFKSVFSDDPDPPKSEHESESPKNPTQNNEQDNPDAESPPKQPNPSHNLDGGGGGGWSFGGLIKTLTVKSESVIETYRRDLKEFGSGLKKEIEVAQGSLGNVSHAIDEFGSSVLKGTTQIISQGKDAILAVDHESDSSESNINQNYSDRSNSKRYSRFDAQVRAIQGDTNTYCEEPEDLDDYIKWKSGFALEEKSEEIESLFEENGAMENIYIRVVPSSVDHETFWFRYFYKVHKLKQAEDLRVNLVKRAISVDEEELSWDVDDDDEEEDESNALPKANLKGNKEVGSKDSEKIVKDEESSVGSSGVVNEMAERSSDASRGDLSENKELDEKNSVKIEKDENPVEVGYSSVADDKEDKVSNVDEGKKGGVVESTGDNVADEKGNLEKNGGVSEEDAVLKSDEKVPQSESSKDSDFSVISSQPSMAEEEDLGWDEIEDLSSIDEKKVSHGGSPNRADLRKRLSAAEEEEDLSWDIEEDDEPVKA